MYFKYLLVIFFLTLFYYFIFNKNKITESFQSYQDCINSGYTKEFCVQTPTSIFGPNVCKCDDGSLGRILPGFRGECVCDTIYY